MIIDAHQHVWDLARSPYRWLGPQVPEWNRTFTFDELRPQLARNGVDATVLVQSDDDDRDTDLMLEVTAPEVVAIVAYVPLDQPERAAERLAELRQDPRVVGIRNLIHDLPDPDWILRPEVDEGLSVLEEADVTFDYVAVLPRHLEHVPTLSERHPDLRIVIDHLAKPPIPDREPWWTLIEAAAQNPQVHAKLSGLYGEPLQPYVDRALDVFGPRRLMYGGDWPISTAFGGYDHTFQTLAATLTGLSDTDRTEIYEGTAKRFYRIPCS
ncbi:amidohydrolase family protein [Kribbella sp. WER1]